MFKIDMSKELRKEQIMNVFMSHIYEIRYNCGQWQLNWKDFIWY